VLWYEQEFLVKYFKQTQNGFHIFCRAEDFAKFIVLRHEMGNCINGIRDINPIYFEANQSPMADRVDDIMSQPGHDLYADRDGFTVDAIVATLEYLNIERWYLKTEEARIDVTQ